MGRHLLATGALCCLYLAVMSGHLFSVDGLEMWRQAAAIAQHGSLQFPEPLRWGALETSNSKYGIGLSLLYVPGILLVGWVPGLHLAGGTGFALLYADRLYTVAGAPIHVLVAAATALLVGRMAVRLGAGKGGSLWAMALYGLGSPAFVYARGDWAQALSGLSWVAALLLALRFRQAGRWFDLAGAALITFYGILVRPVEGVLVVPFLLLAISATPAFWRWPGTTFRAAAAVSAACAAGVAATLAVNWARLGSPLATGYAGEGWTTPIWVGLPGALISPGRGLLWEFPALLLVPLGISLLWQNGRRIEAVILVGLPLAELLSTATWSTWWGGANWGLRLFVPALPLLSVAAGMGVNRLRGPAAFWLPAAALAGGLLFAIPGVVVDLFAWPAAVANGSEASFHLHAYPPLGAWSGLRQVFGFGLGDHGSVDVVWFRLAGSSRLWLLPFAVLILASAAQGVAALRPARPAYARSRPMEAASAGMLGDGRRP